MKAVRMQTLKWRNPGGRGEPVVSARTLFLTSKDFCGLLGCVRRHVENVGAELAF